MIWLLLWPASWLGLYLWASHYCWRKFAEAPNFRELLSATGRPRMVWYALSCAFPRTWFDLRPYLFGPVGVILLILARWP